MKKIAIITNIPSPYRVDLFFYLQSNYKDFDIHIIYTNSEEDNRLWKINEEKMINTHILKSKVLKIHQKLDVKYIHIPSNVFSVLNSINPDIIIGFEYNISALQSLIWSKIHKKKFIHLTDGTLFSERNINIIQKIMRKIIIGNANAYIASSTKAKEKLLKWGASENEIFISLLTVDINKMNYQENKQDSNILLYIGSIIKRKGLDLLFKALANVNETFELRIVGNGEKLEIQELKDMTEKLNISDKIKWIGFKSGEELKQEYINAKAFVLPTREDCFGLVLLEAMCTATPIISSKYADGAYDIIEDGINGYIVDPYNEEEFAKCIKDILLSNKMLISAKEYSNVELKKFSFNEVGKGYLKAIEYVIK